MEREAYLKIKTDIKEYIAERLKGTVKELSMCLHLNKTEV